MLSIILFTQSYPYDFASEHLFIEPEITYLVENGAKIITVPRARKGKRLSLPNGVQVAEKYADFLQQNLTLPMLLQLTLTSRAFFEEIVNQPSLLASPAKILRLILFCSRVELSKQWLRSFITTQPIDKSSYLLYSYWLDHAATAIGTLRHELSATRAVARAHGYDIYEEHYYPYYWPFRRKTLESLDQIFFASDAGKKYLCERYPEFTWKFETSRLGTKDPAFIAKPSSDGVFRIVSCAHIVPVKRLDLLLDGIAAAARLRPNQTFDWVHFGDGKGSRALEKDMQEKFSSNIRARLLGHVPHHEIMRHYREHPVDVFMNVSSTEGTPVSVMEAISCGIPIIATAVGGNPEIVSAKNGTLLTPNPTPAEIAKAIFTFLDRPEETTGKRKGSREVWIERYNAEVNFGAFAQRLKSIGEQ